MRPRLFAIALFLITASLTTTALPFTHLAAPAQALSLACCESLEKMEAKTDLLIRGKALMGEKDAKTLNLSQREYKQKLAKGEAIPWGVNLLVHDDKWQFVERYMIIPVQVIEVLKGKETRKVIGVVQHPNDIWSTVMLKNSEYLFFLQRPVDYPSLRNVYYDFYGQGKYNLDGSDTQEPGDPAGYHDRAEVRARYGDQIRFAAPPSQMLQQNQDKTTPEASSQPNWLGTLLSAVSSWLENFV